MGFHEIEFPRDISYGSSGGVAHSTAVVELASGHEQRIVRSNTPRNVFDVSYALKDWATLRTVLDFNRARQGRAHGFRYWDPSDYSTNPLQTPWNDDTVDATDEDVVIGTGGGGVTDFQLAKVYTSGPTTRTRAITRPISGTVVVSLDSGSGPVSQPSGWSVDITTGIITFTTAPTNGVVVRAGCKFNVPVRFEDDELSISLDDFDNGSCPPIRLIEILEGAVVDDLYPYRGASTQTSAESISLSPAMGHFVQVDMTAASQVVRLPNHAAYFEGHDVWTLENIGANDFDVEYEGTSLGTVAAGDWATISLGRDNSGARAWVLLL